MNRILFVTVLCIAAASAATKLKTSSASKRGFGIGTHNQKPEVLTVSHGQGHSSGGGSGGGGGGGYEAGGWGQGQEAFSLYIPPAPSSSEHKADYPALADTVALVLNLLVLAAFGGLVYLLLSPLLGGGDNNDGWGRSSSPYYEAFKDGGVLSRVLNSIDYVDTTFAVMKISGEGCKKRVACEMEQAAGRNKVFGYASSFFRNRMRSMDLYRDAMVNGDKQDDCVAKYPNCEYTLVEKVGKWIGN